MRTLTLSKEQDKVNKLIKINEAIKMSALSYDINNTENGKCVSKDFIFKLNYCFSLA